MGAISTISCWRIDVKELITLFDSLMTRYEVTKFVDFIEDITHEFIYDICHFNETGDMLKSIQDQHAQFSICRGPSRKSANNMTQRRTDIINAASDKRAHKNATKVPKRASRSTLFQDTAIAFASKLRK